MSTEVFELSNDSLVPIAGEFPQVIRRDNVGDASGKPRVVSGLGPNIESPLWAAPLAAGGGATIGQQVQAEIEFRLKRERPLFVHVEHLQDLVEETLTELGHFKVALTYAKYRAKRAALREIEVQPALPEEGNIA